MEREREKEMEKEKIVKQSQRKPFSVQYSFLFYGQDSASKDKRERRLVRPTATGDVRRTCDGSTEK